MLQQLSLIVIISRMIHNLVTFGLQIHFTGPTLRLKIDLNAISGLRRLIFMIKLILVFGAATTCLRAGLAKTLRKWEDFGDGTPRTPHMEF